jgi:hypothetical protein
MPLPRGKMLDEQKKQINTEGYLRYGQGAPDEKRV